MHVRKKAMKRQLSLASLNCLQQHTGSETGHVEDVEKSESSGAKQFMVFSGTTAEGYEQKNVRLGLVSVRFRENKKILCRSGILRRETTDD